MKAELRLSNHSIYPGENMIEVWWEGRMVAGIYGADGPGIRVFTKHQLQVSACDMESMSRMVNAVEVIVL